MLLKIFQKFSKNKKKIVAIIPDIIQTQTKDSFFVYTDYCKFLESANIVPIILPYIKNYTIILKKVDGVILIGGGIYFKNKRNYIGKSLKETNPLRYKFEINHVIPYCLRYSKPILAICRGAETVAEFFGAKIIDISNINKTSSKNFLNHYETNHIIKINKNTLLYNYIRKQKIKVNSFHTKLILNLPNKLKISALSEDNVIEAFESKNYKIIAYQFHPERLSSKQSKLFLKPFLNFLNK